MCPRASIPSFALDSSQDAAMAETATERRRGLRSLQPGAPFHPCHHSEEREEEGAELLVLETGPENGPASFSLRIALWT